MTYLPPLSQVTTSSAVSDVPVLIRESTKLKSETSEQLVSLTAGKFTFSHMLLGRYGVPEATRDCVTFVESSEYL